MASSEFFYQIIATLPGSSTKSIINKTESQVMDYVISYKVNGTINERWGDNDNCSASMKMGKK